MNNKLMGTVSNILFLKPEPEGSPGELSERLAANLGFVLRKYAGGELKIIDPGERDVLKSLDDESLAILLTAGSFKASYPVPESWFSEKDPDRFICIGIDEGNAGDLPEGLRKSCTVNLGGQDEGSPAYWSRLLDVASMIRSFQAGPGSGGGSEGTRVYLAQAEADVMRERNLLNRELTEHGIMVDPDRDLRYSGSGIKSFVQSCVDRSRLAIHLLGNAYGTPPDENGKSLAEEQFDEVTDYLEAIDNDPVHAEKEIHRLVWIAPEHSPSDPRQEELITRIRRNIETLHRTEIVQTPLELFKTLVIRRLKSGSTETGEGYGQAGDRGETIYIIGSQEDQDRAVKLAGLGRQEGYSSGMLKYGGNHLDLLNEHKRLLRTCEAAVIVYTSGNRAWLRSKIMDLLKAPGLERGRPLEFKAVLACGQDALDDYPVPAGMEIIRGKDMETAFRAVVKNMKTLKT